MKLDDGDRLINVRICHEDNDVMLAARSGKCIRFPVTEVRVFVGRNSTGVRGIKLAEGDEVVSMSILNHSDATSEERDEYQKISSAAKRIQAERGGDCLVPAEETGIEMNVLTPEKYLEMREKERLFFRLRQPDTASVLRLMNTGLPAAAVRVLPIWRCLPATRRLSARSRLRTTIRL